MARPRLRGSRCRRQCNRKRPPGRLIRARPTRPLFCYFWRSTADQSRSSTYHVARDAGPRAPAARSRARRRPRGGGACLRTRSLTSASVDVGTPPHVALVTFERSPGQKPELGLVENARPTLDVDGTRYPRGMLDVIERWHDAASGGRTSDEMLETERKGDPVPVASVTCRDPGSPVHRAKLPRADGEVDSSLPGIPRRAWPRPSTPSSSPRPSRASSDPGRRSRSRRGSRTRSTTKASRRSPARRTPRRNRRRNIRLGRGFRVHDHQRRHGARRAEAAPAVVPGQIVRHVCPMGPGSSRKRAAIEAFRSDASPAAREARPRRQRREHSGGRRGHVRDVSTYPRAQAVNARHAPRRGRHRHGDARGGAGMDPRGFLRSGDACEVTVHGVGVLSNPVE